jgi:hypothetical protein
MNKSHQASAFGFSLCRDSLTSFFKNCAANTKDADLKKRIHLFLNSNQTYLDYQECFPVLDKSDLYSENRSDFNSGGNIIASAGSRFGNVTFRLSRSESVNSVVSLSKILLGKFNLNPVSTLVVSAYPTRVEFPRELTVLECPGRPDILETFLEKYSAQFENIVLICMPVFLGYLAKWSQQLQKQINKLVFITGGSPCFPEFKDYISQKLQSPVQHRWANLFGVAEISPGFAIQNSENEEFNYNPNNLLIEEVNGNLVATHLETSALPEIIRYKTGDLISLVAPGQFIHLGRNSTADNNTDKLLKILYSNYTIAQCLTGRVRANNESFTMEHWSDVAPTESQKTWVAKQFKDFSINWVAAPRGFATGKAWDQIDLLKKGREYEQA